MVYFPLLRHLAIENYGLYPGPQRNGKFEVEFKHGLTLILGANGLGKTTLMTLIFRLIAGTYDLSLPEEIGMASLEDHELNSAAKRQFAERVNDGAQQAHATLRFSVSDIEFLVVRELTNLALVRLEVGGHRLPTDEKAYHTAILNASKLGTYADWLLILRTLVFFFEDRRALIWDPGAQRQLLRCLFLSPAQSGDWTRQERSILALDSRMRNLQAALRREQRERAKTVQKIKGASNIRPTLAAAESSLEQLNNRHADLVARVEAGEDSRQKARLNALRAQSEHDQALRELERAQQLAIEAHLPQAAESMRFLYARLMSDETCLACGTHGLGTKRAALESALVGHRCLVCDSDLPRNSNVTDINDRRIIELQERVESTAIRALEQARLRDEVSEQYQADNEALSECAVERNDVQDNIRSLISQLPPDERKVNEQQDKLKAIEELVVQLRAELQVERAKFAASLEDYRDGIQINAEAIKQHFEQVANGFLFEQSGLSWAPIRRTVGQAGGMEPVEYPAFAVELSGSDFVGLQRRGSPSQVSESQREFIDLAFRMALIEVASPSHASTLAVDAPESSLDAVFVDKAAQVLSQFANSDSGSRLIITSNLGAGELVPELLRATAEPGQRMAPLVDLFAAGVPTRAMLESKDAYDRYWAQLRKRVEDERDG
ncbi:AAA family ATPase [Burkholderia pseudomallei]|uniref:AAA family ATPase n=1 Tax=Burkholderia pseudomallei TaxID=28450 RepID=UPI000976CA2A|nr:AAA family ATPase [Burkholderia pseudomallei]MBF3522433.1 AAA family ATPase [Burkholderia pseudomallei]